MSPKWSAPNFLFSEKKVWGTHVGTPILRHPRMFPTGHPHMSEHLGIIRHHQETPRDSSNHSLGHQCSLSGSIGLGLNFHKLPICLPLKQGKKKRGTFWPVPTKIKPTTVQAREKPPYGLIDTCTSWRHSMER